MRASWWENHMQFQTNKEIDLMQSAKMIYPDKKLAGAILCKVKKRYPNDEWSVIVVPTGFEVTRKPKPLFGGYSASCKLLAGSAKSPVPIGSVVTVTLSYSNQSPHFIECFHGGKKIWVGKTTLIAFNVDNMSNDRRDEDVRQIRQKAGVHLKEPDASLAQVPEVGDRRRRHTKHKVAPTESRSIGAIKDTICAIKCTKGP